MAGLLQVLRHDGVCFVCLRQNTSKGTLNGGREIVRGPSGLYRLQLLPSQAPAISQGTASTGSSVVCTSPAGAARMGHVRDSCRICSIYWPTLARLLECCGGVCAGHTLLGGRMCRAYIVYNSLSCQWSGGSHRRHQTPTETLRPEQRQQQKAAVADRALPVQGLFTQANLN
jgi:hypothetical protein